MAIGLPCFTLEIGSGGDKFYASTHEYYSVAADTPASQYFQSRVLEDLEYERGMDLIVWGGSPRGVSSIGVCKLANADGGLDAIAAKDMRDQPVVIKRGYTGDAYSTFTTVASVYIDKIDASNALLIVIYFKGIAGRLERAAQLSVYPNTTVNQALRGRPKPFILGKVFQAPVVQPNPFGNGRFDIHDTNQWTGIDALFDSGVPLLIDASYQRAHDANTNGFERLTAITGRQVVNVRGQWIEVSLVYNETMASHANWTETNGGVGGRDASLVSSETRLLNTAGGADLTLNHNTFTATADTDLWFFEFECSQYTSGSAIFITGLSPAAGDVTINGLGLYSGVARQTASARPRFLALNGSACDLRVKNFKMRKIRVLEKLDEVVAYLASAQYNGKGPLTYASEIDTTALTALATAAPYSLGLYVGDSTKIANLLDSVMMSFGGYWYTTRLGKLSVGRLEVPGGAVPSFAWTIDEIGDDGIQIELDEAPGLTNRLLGKKNWVAYGENEPQAGLNYIQLNSSDKGAAVTLSNSNYTESTNNPGIVRLNLMFPGERIYYEFTPTALGGANGMGIAIANASATLTTGPGADGNSLGYRANGQTFIGGVGSAYHTAWGVNGVIGMFVDSRDAAAGMRNRHYKVYWANANTFAAGVSVGSETGYIVPTVSTQYPYLAVGSATAAAVDTGTLNLGQSAFTYTVPDDYIAPAWHRQLCILDYRNEYYAPVTFATCYNHGLNSRVTSDFGTDPYASQSVGGVPTLLVRDADIRTEGQRIPAMYQHARFIYTFPVLIAPTTAEQLEPGTLVSATYPKQGLTTPRRMRIKKIKGKLLDGRVLIEAWGMGKYTASSWDAANSHANMVTTGTSALGFANSRVTKNAGGAWRTAKAFTAKSSGKYLFGMRNVSGTSVVFGLSTAGHSNANMLGVGAAQISVGIQVSPNASSDVYVNNAAATSYTLPAASGTRYSVIAVDITNGKIYFWNETATAWANGADPDAGIGGHTITAGSSYVPGISLFNTAESVDLLLHPDDLPFLPNCISFTRGWEL